MMPQSVSAAVGACRPAAAYPPGTGTSPGSATRASQILTSARASPNSPWTRSLSAGLQACTKLAPDPSNPADNTALFEQLVTTAWARSARQLSAASGFVRSAPENCSGIVSIRRARGRLQTGHLLCLAPCDPRDY